RDMRGALARQTVEFGPQFGCRMNVDLTGDSDDVPAAGFIGLHVHDRFSSDVSPLNPDQLHRRDMMNRAVLGPRRPKGSLRTADHYLLLGSLAAPFSCLNVPPIHR